MANEETQSATVDLTKVASIDNVYLALRSCHLGARIEVTDHASRVFMLTVQGLQHEDGSGCSFLIRGVAELTSSPWKNMDGRRFYSYEAHLDYKGGKRKGWIKTIG